MPLINFIQDHLEKNISLKIIISLKTLNKNVSFNIQIRRFGVFWAVFFYSFLRVLCVFDDSRFHTCSKQCNYLIVNPHKDQTSHGKTKDLDFPHVLHVGRP